MDIEAFGAWNAVDGNTATFGAIEKRTREEQPWIRINLDKVRTKSQIICPNFKNDVFEHRD